MFQTKNDNNWPRSFQDEVRNVKLLMDDGRKTIAIHVGHLSDTGYHKKALFWSVLVFFLMKCEFYIQERENCLSLINTSHILQHKQNWFL